MAKEKLFTPEDFDKPKNKSLCLRYKGVIICIIALLIIAIVLCCIFYYKEHDTTEQQQAEQIVQVCDAGVTSVETEAAETQNTPESQETERIQVKETGTNSAHAPETTKQEAKQADDKNTHTTQPTNISDNIEQEAMNVIRGDYGNLPERRERLGSKYPEIQNRVNQLKKEGVF